MVEKNLHSALQRLVYDVCALVPNPRTFLVKLAVSLLMIEAFLVAMHFIVITLQYQLDIEAADGSIGGFDLNDEATLAVWFSSLQLLLIGICTLALSWIDKQHFIGIRNSRVWLFATYLFIFLSADETGGLHEVLGQSLVMLFPSVNLSASMWWSIPYMIVIGSVLAFMFIRFRGHPVPMLLLSTGSLCWFIANTLDHNYLIASDVIIAMEEALEMLGGSLLLIGCLHFLFEQAMEEANNE